MTLPGSIARTRPPPGQQAATRGHFYCRWIRIPVPPTSRSQHHRPPRRRAGRNPVIIMIVILLCLTVGAVAGMALLLQSDWRISAPGSGESSAQQAASSDAPHSGQVATLTPSQVTVGCQAPQSTDGAGAPVVYVPEQMSDGKMNTAWRCNGNGVGQVVTFGFPAETTIAEVGLVNGYAKVDPASGTQRYGEYRRITKVTWTFADGTSFQQSLNDGVETVQKLSIPPQSGGQRHTHHRGQHRAWIDCQGSRCRLDL